MKNIKVRYTLSQYNKTIYTVKLQRRKHLWNERHQVIIRTTISKNSFCISIIVAILTVKFGFNV